MRASSDARSLPPTPTVLRKDGNRDRLASSLPPEPEPVLGPESGVRDGEFLVAVDVRAQAGEARIRMASRIERDWLQPNGLEIVHSFDADSGIVRALEVERYDALTVRERPVPPDPDEAARLLADAWVVADPLGRR